MQLNILNKVPTNLLTCDVKEVHALLGGPTIIHLKGKSSECLFLSSLLHGNEATSFLALQKLLKEYQDKELPRDLIIFIGNTLAASQGQRHLPGQADYNRIWKEGETREHQLAKDALMYAKQFELFANIDIHNNTGKNPYYGCINLISDQYIELASYFSDQIVYFTEPSEVQSMAFAKLCPSVTIEAGLSGQPEGIEKVYSYIKKILHLDKFQDEFQSQMVDVHHTIGRIKVKKEALIDFDYNHQAQSDLSLDPDIDGHNFVLLPKNTKLGYFSNKEMIYVEDNFGRDITTDILNFESHVIKTNKVFIPSMFTKDVYVMKEDCLGYVMEKMSSPH